MTQPRPLIVVPAFNEELSIECVVSSICALGYTTVVVDDCSTDQTAIRARRAGAVVIRLPINLGVGGALRVGFQFALEHGYESVVQVDADGQHPVDQISDLELEANNSGADLVIGSRYAQNDTAFPTTVARRFMMWCLAVIASKLSGVTLTDTTSGFRFIGNQLLTLFAKELPDYYLGDTFEATLIAARFGFRIKEIPARIVPRTLGKSSISSASAALMIVKVILLSLVQNHRLERISTTYLYKTGMSRERC